MTGTPDKPLPKGAKIVSRTFVQTTETTMGLQKLNYAELALGESGQASQAYAERKVVWSLGPVYCRSRRTEGGPYHNSGSPSRKPVIDWNESVLARECPECKLRVSREPRIEFHCSITGWICDSRGEYGQSGDCRTCFVAFVKDLDLENALKRVLKTTVIGIAKE